MRGWRSVADRVWILRWRHRCPTQIHHRSELWCCCFPNRAVIEWSVCLAGRITDCHSSCRRLCVHRTMLAVNGVFRVHLNAQPMHISSLSSTASQFGAFSHNSFRVSFNFRRSLPFWSFPGFVRSSRFCLPIKLAFTVSRMVRDPFDDPL
jgi:hypothetical protein